MSHTRSTGHAESQWDHSEEGTFSRSEGGFPTASRLQAEVELAAACFHECLPNSPGFLPARRSEVLLWLIHPLKCSCRQVDSNCVMLQNSPQNKALHQQRTRLHACVTAAEFHVAQGPVQEWRHGYTDAPAVRKLRINYVVWHLSLCPIGLYRIYPDAHGSRLEAR